MTDRSPHPNEPRDGKATQRLNRKKVFIQLFQEHWKDLVKVASGAFFGGGAAGVNGWWLSIIPIVKELVLRGVLFSVVWSVMGTCIVMWLNRTPRTKGSSETSSKSPWALLRWLVLFCLSVVIYFCANWLAARPSMGEFGRDVVYQGLVPITYGVCFGLILASFAELLFFLLYYLNHFVDKYPTSTNG